MTFNKLKSALVLAAATGLATPLSALATNGYFAHGYGTAAKALGGAGVALSQDSMAGATNPAGMAMVGTRFDMGIEIFNAPRGYKTDNNTFVGFSNEQRSETDWFFVPHIGYNYMLDDNDSVGVTIFGNGFATRYNTYPVYGFASQDSGAVRRTGVFLVQLMMAFTYAHKFNDETSVGIAPIFIYQRIKIEGLRAFEILASGGSSPYVSNNGGDNAYGGGVKLGGQVGVGGGVVLGASYQSRLYTSKFHKYRDIFADQGEFDIPPTFTVGLAWKATKSLTFLVDYQHIAYGDIDSIANPETSPRPSAELTLGSPNGRGFGWHDINVYKVGIQWQPSEDWILRIGYNKGDIPMDHGYELYPNTTIPVSSTQFNLIAPAVTTDHFTAGFTKTLKGGDEIGVSYFHGFSRIVEGHNALLGGGYNQLWMRQNGLEINYGVKW